MENISKEQLQDLMDGCWSNAACCGYIILTCQRYGLSKQQIDEMLCILNDLFDSQPVEYAKRTYKNY